MRFLKTVCSTLAFLLVAFQLPAQVNPNQVLQSNIHSVRLHGYGDQQSLPIIKLNSADRLELHFDDLGGNVKNYYYTFQLCDANWRPVNLSAFDFIKGFTQQRFTNYRMSSIAFQRYTHYQAVLPEQNCLPTKSGNYLLKVFLDGDTTKLAFTRGMLVVNPKISVVGQVLQPFTTLNYRTHQRIKFSINIEGLSNFGGVSGRDLKVIVLQNDRWDNAQYGSAPTFVRGNILEYNTENSFVFPGGKEWRWLDLRSFRLLSDRIDSAASNLKQSTELYVKPDIDRSVQKYVFFPDLDGLYQVQTYETINPYWQGDYATVHFRFVNPGMNAYAGKELYLMGQLTDYRYDNNSRMTFNAEKGYYEGSLLLKQGYYNYGYLLVDPKDPTQNTELEGNYWETQNMYTVLVYYKSFTDQYDQLLGIARINSRSDRPGFSF